MKVYMLTCNPYTHISMTLEAMHMYESMQYITMIQSFTHIRQSVETKFVNSRLQLINYAHQNKGMGVQIIPTDL